MFGSFTLVCDVTVCSHQCDKTITRGDDAILPFGRNLLAAHILRASQFRRAVGIRIASDPSPCRPASMSLGLQRASLESRLSMIASREQRPMHPPALQLRDIHASYGKKKVLHGVSLSIDVAEIVALVGPNGAGKSTLLKVAMGLVQQTEGRVLFNNETINRESTYRRVCLGAGYLSQTANVFPSLSVRENLEIVGDCRNRSDVESSLTSVMDHFPVVRRLWQRRAGLLSGGERQCLALAMVLARKPAVVLLDEPFAGLSPKLVEELVTTLREISSTWKTSMFIVEQNVRAALTLCRRAVLLVNGEISNETNEPQSWLENRDAVESAFLLN